MIPRAEIIQKRENESFVVGEYCAKWFERSWHYHSEFELLLITHGHGTRVIGDNSSPFREGDLVLVSGNMPHAWFSSASFFEPDNEANCESIYIQFRRNIFGSAFANLPEMRSISVLLDEARYGLVLNNGPSYPIYDKLKAMPGLYDLDRLLGLLELLNLFRKGDYERLVSESYIHNTSIHKSSRIKKVHEYVLNHYMDEIRLQSVASLVGMNESSFCRFFKRMTGKTLSNYVKEMRIDLAQQLLINTNLPSNQIAFECGFSSPAYFNQCFKSIRKQSPLEYRALTSGEYAH
jgi:AraC-like DNA-binding protein